MGNKSVHCYLFTNYYRYKMYRIYVKKKNNNSDVISKP